MPKPAIRRCTVASACRPMATSAAAPTPRSSPTRPQGVWQKMIRDYKDTVWDDRAKDGTKIRVGLKWQPAGGTKTLVRLKMGEDKPFELDPLQVGQNLNALKDPPRSGGLLAAPLSVSPLPHLRGRRLRGRLHPRRQRAHLSARKDKETVQGPPRRYRGHPHRTRRRARSSGTSRRRTRRSLAFEATIDQEDDPCEVYLSDYRKVDGRLLPHRIEVRYGNEVYGSFTVTSYKVISRMVRSSGPVVRRHIEAATDTDH